MSQALLGIGAGAAGAFGGAYDAARKNRQQSQLDDFQIQNAQRDAQALSALGQLGGNTSATPGMPPSQPPMPQPGGAAMPRPGSSIMPSPGSQVIPPGIGQVLPPPGPMRSMSMPIPPTMAAQAPGGPPVPPMLQQGGMQAMAPGGQPRPTMPFPGPVPSAGLTPASAPGGGPPSSPPPGGLRGREQLDPAFQGRGGMPQAMPQANTVRWDQAMQMIASKNPGIKPDVLMRATDMFMQKFGDKQNIMDWREQQIGWREQQIASRERMATEAAQMKFQLASMTDERIRDISQGNTDLKLRLEAQREAARKEIVETQQAGATERTGMQIEGRKDIVGQQEAGKGERLATTEAGRKERQEIGIGAKETMQERGIEAAGARQTERLGVKQSEGEKTRAEQEKLQRERLDVRQSEGAAGREAAGARQTQRIEAGKEQQASKQQFTREEREANERFKTEVQRRNIEYGLTKQQKAIETKAKSDSKLSDSEIDSLAKGIAEYKGKPYTGGRGETLRVMAKVRALNPGYREDIWNAKNRAVTQFAVGKEGQKLASLQTAYYHLGTLQEVAKNLPGGKLRITNTISNRLAVSGGAAAPNTFDAIKAFVAGEIVKAAAGVGAGSVKERLDLAEKLSRDNSSDQIKDTIAKFKELLQGQYAGLKRQYESATGEKDFDSKFEPLDPGRASPTKGVVDGIPWEMTAP